MIPTFEEFFEAVWRHSPYAWQSRLAARVAAEGWPDVLDLPTGSGKTAVLDIALHHLVADGGREAPRRVILVVDRRVIVDQVAERALRIREAIEKGADAATRAMREALRRMVGDDAPLLASPVLRGGTVRDDSWAAYPHVPVLAASTVDQVGSRLLFRGYGHSQRAQPIHAGLMGCDTLFLLDEVHLARPFACTLAQLTEIRGEEGPVPRRTRVVEMSATPGALQAEAQRFGLTREDREDPRLAPVLEASKPVELVPVKVAARAPESEKRAVTARRAAAAARDMVSEGRLAVAAIVNRVDTARRLWSELASDPDLDCELITGRMRPLDQAATIERVADRVRAGREAEPDDAGRPLVVVATQCLEAGADYDFDGLVTECASLDALRQRFGRLDRRGEAASRIGRTARGVVLGRTDMKSTSPDPVYDDALWETWQWLDSQGEDATVDFASVRLEARLDELETEKIEELLARPEEAPVLMPVYLEQWSQTSPRPHADPDVSLFLHGIPKTDARPAAEVEVVWRADLSGDELLRARSDEALTRCLVDRIAAVPPASIESLSLPIWAFRRWLDRKPAGDAADELSDAEGTPGSHTARPSTAVLLWQGRNESRVVAASDVAPGSVVVVPAELGGLGPPGTFDPEATGLVADLGDAAQTVQRGRAVLRLDPDVWPALAGRLGPLEAAGTDESRDRRSIIGEVLTNLRDTEWSDDDRKLAWILEQLGPDPRVLGKEACEDDARPGTVVLLERGAGTARPGTTARPSIGVDDAEDEERTSFRGAGRQLAEHLEGVASLAREFAVRLGLPDGIVTTLWWAGRVHDVGKADPRFQLMLHGGDAVAVRFGEVLAKSAVPWQDLRTRNRARRLAGYPDGQRHELVSLGMLEAHGDLRRVFEHDGGDWDLLLYLVATHHGWARPLAPALALDEECADAVVWKIGDLEVRGSTAHGYSRLDSGLVDRFFRLGRRYGWHELAYLEAVLRLADHRRSEREEQE